MDKEHMSFFNRVIIHLVSERHWKTTTSRVSLELRKEDTLRGSVTGLLLRRTQMELDYVCKVAVWVNVAEESTCHQCGQLSVPRP